MKNVLIICGTFPPQSMVGGLRPGMFAKYLKQFGWNPWVITRAFPENDPRVDNTMSIDLDHIEDQIIRVEYGSKDEENYLKERTFIKKIRDFFYPEFSSPPGVYIEVKKRAVQLMKEQRFDLIFTTAPDNWETALGSYLSRRYKIRFVADFRDIKEQEEGLKRTFREHLQVYRFTLRRYFNTRKASLLTTVSKYHAGVLSKKLSRKVDVIYNGYDSEIFQPKNLQQRASPGFTIIYTGRILNTWYQNPEILFTAVDQLIEEGKIGENEITIDFYGTDKTALQSLFNNMQNKEFVNFYNRIPYQQVPKKLSEAHLLLVLTNKGRRGILTTKLFEYAGMKKPILCVPGDASELDDLIATYDLGYSIDNVEDMKTKLIEWNNAHKENLFPDIIDNKVDYFTRLNQTKELALSFDSLFE